MITISSLSLVDDVPDYKIEPVYIGPTWKRDENGEFILPVRTLGWQILRWIRTYVGASEPWIPTKEQSRFLLWWYALDHRGKFVYRDGVLQRLKGWRFTP